MIVQNFNMESIFIPDVWLIHPFVTRDDRGEVRKTYGQDLPENGLFFSPLETLVIESKQSVLRGLHFQEEKWQSRLIECPVGKIWGTVVDLRPSSNTYGKWQGFELDKMTELFVPQGCAFGSLALENSIIICECGENFYQEQLCSGIRWDDADIGIDWPLELLGKQPIVSEKDEALQLFGQFSTHIGGKGKNGQRFAGK